MKEKPSVCVIDEDPTVGQGWAQALGTEANLFFFQNHTALFEMLTEQPGLIASFSCIILGRYFKDLGMDMVVSDVPEALRSYGAQAIFLNWQGYVTKDEVSSKFDGKLFQRFGVRWPTLRMRVQKFGKGNKEAAPRQGELKTFSKDSPEALRRSPNTNVASSSSPSSRRAATPPRFEPIHNVNRPAKCSELLKEMARNADGPHKEKIEFYAVNDTSTGMKLLEAIYDKLLADKNRPMDCPSRYINSSPVIAKRILKEALFG